MAGVIMKVYVYKGAEYRNERQLREAIFKAERKAFAKCETENDWARHSVEIREVEQVLTEEQLARQARTKRDRLLSACDYYVMPDYPATEEGLAEVKAYRQALRDITKQEDFPFDIVWPDYPNALK